MKFIYLSVHLKIQFEKDFWLKKDFDERIYPQLILPISLFLNDKYFVNRRRIVEERDHYCKHFGAKKIF